VRRFALTMVLPFQRTGHHNFIEFSGGRWRWYACARPDHGEDAWFECELVFQH
jgi:hypothetical protein